MDINEDGNVAFSKRRSETIDFWQVDEERLVCG